MASSPSAMSTKVASSALLADRSARRADEATFVDIALGDDAIEGRCYAKIRFDVLNGTSSFPDSLCVFGERLHLGLGRSLVFLVQLDTRAIRLNRPLGDLHIIAGNYARRG